MEKTTLKSVSGKPLQLYVWLIEKPRAVVQLVHGMAEHMGRYDRLALALNAAGYAVVGHDHLGHGPIADKNELGYFASKDGWDCLIRDMKQVTDYGKQRFPGVPYVLLGHSMGSFATREYLLRYGGELNACRVIFGEADGFPGLTVDLFNDLLVSQTLSVGIERRKEEIFPLLVELLHSEGREIRGFYERNDVPIRALEGLEQGKGWFLDGGSALTEICENGVRYAVDVESGQKTGFFLDQKFNRLAVARLAEGRRVLDCFTHTGSFALNAAMGGAERVTAVDVSASAIEMARLNARRNGLEERMDFVTADVFELLPELKAKGGAPYDFIILDPPAFTKSRRTADRAERGYKEINLRALQLRPRGGYFATASCSHFMPSERFESMLRSAARDAGVELRQIEARQQAPDHPILWNVPETDYLKFYLFQVV